MCCCVEAFILWEQRPFIFNFLKYFCNLIFKNRSIIALQCCVGFCRTAVWIGHCCCSVTKSQRLFETPWTAAHQTSLSFTISRSLLKLLSLESVMPSNHLILCRALLLLPSIFPSIRVLPSESALRIRWLKYWSFSFSIGPCNEYSGFIFFRIDWFDSPESAVSIHTNPSSWASLRPPTPARTKTFKATNLRVVRMRSKNLWVGYWIQ